MTVNPKININHVILPQLVEVVDYEWFVDYEW